MERPRVDLLSLRYLALSGRPLWGGHLQRGEPVSDPDMRRWIEDGWIKAVGTEGYVITEAGRQMVLNRDDATT